VLSRELRVVRLEAEIHSGGRELAGPGALIWIDCTPAPENLAWLGERFGFHPLALEDCAHEGQRPKFEEYPGNLFAVVHRIAKAPDDSGLLSHEIHAFLTSEALVTVHGCPLAEIDRVFEHCCTDREGLGRGADFALYQVWDAVTDAHFAVGDDLTDGIDELAAEVVDDEAGGESELLGRILQARRSLGQLRRQLAPQREVFAALSRQGDARVRPANAPYFRDLTDHLLRITEEVDVSRDLLGSAMDAYLSMVNNRLSVVMTRLTLLSTIFLPLTFLTGFFGMNLELFPAAVSKVLVVASLILLPVGMLVWFKRRGWL
jgi:magnesium transporter